MTQVLFWVVGAQSHQMPPQLSMGWGTDTRNTIQRIQKIGDSIEDFIMIVCKGEIVCEYEQDCL